MTHRHWSDEELLLRIYEGGAEPASTGFADGCQHCLERWEELVAARAVVLQPVEVSAARLARQREAIRERVAAGQRGWTATRLVPTLATACLLLLGVILGTPEPKSQPTLAQTDENFYSDVYEMAVEYTPSPIAPIQGLFQIEEQLQ